MWIFSVSLFVFTFTFTVLLCMFANGKEWEFTACEWEILGVYKSIPGHLHCLRVNCRPAYRRSGGIIARRLPYIYPSPHRKPGVTVNGIVPRSYGSYIIFAILSMICNVLFGLVALVLAGLTHSLTLLLYV